MNLTNHVEVTNNLIFGQKWPLVHPDILFENFPLSSPEIKNDCQEILVKNDHKCRPLIQKEKHPFESVQPRSQDDSSYLNK